MFSSIYATFDVIVWKYINVCYEFYQQCIDLNCDQIYDEIEA
jgi:hypothetical protein